MVERADEADDGEVCTHHWRIATPAGQTSTGVCVLCGARREFENYSSPAAVSRTRKTGRAQQASS